jgi:hypothetical protein
MDGRKGEHCATVSGNKLDHGMKVKRRNSAAPPKRPSPSKPSTPPPARTGAAEPQAPRLNLDRWIRKVRELPAVREDLIQRVKAEIAAGKYETPEKLEIAAQRMLEDLLEA